MDKDTYFDNLIRSFKNNKFFASILLFFLILSAIITFVVSLSQISFLDVNERSIGKISNSSLSSTNEIQNFFVEGFEYFDSYYSLFFSDGVPEDVIILYRDCLTPACDKFEENKLVLFQGKEIMSCYQTIIKPSTIELKDYEQCIEKYRINGIKIKASKSCEGVSDCKYLNFTHRYTPKSYHKYGYYLLIIPKGADYIPSFDKVDTTNCNHTICVNEKGLVFSARLNQSHGIRNVRFDNKALSDEENIDYQFNYLINGYPFYIYTDICSYYYTSKPPKEWWMLLGGLPNAYSFTTAYYGEISFSILLLDGTLLYQRKKEVVSHNETCEEQEFEWWPPNGLKGSFVNIQLEFTDKSITHTDTPKEVINIRRKVY